MVWRLPASSETTQTAALLDSLPLDLQMQPRTLAPANVIVTASRRTESDHPRADRKSLLLLHNSVRLNKDCQSWYPWSQDSMSKNQQTDKSKGMPMRVLIIEDTRERQDILKQLYKDHAWVLVHTVARANSLLDAFEFDVVSLDYDLAGEATGDEVARHISAGSNSGARVIVHSMNPHGRDRIRELLPAATVLPVASMITTNSRFKRLREALEQGPNFDWSFAVKGSRGEHKSKTRNGAGEDGVSDRASPSRNQQCE